MCVYFRPQKHGCPLEVQYSAKQEGPSLWESCSAWKTIANVKINFLSADQHSVKRGNIVWIFNFTSQNLQTKANTTLTFIDSTMCWCQQQKRGNSNYTKGSRTKKGEALANLKQHNGVLWLIWFWEDTYTVLTHPS